MKISYCRCGCGKPVTKTSNRYIHNHHRPMMGKKHSKETRRKIGISKVKSLLEREES